MCKRITAVLLLVLLFAAQSAFAENDPLRGRYDALREQKIGLGLKKDQDALVALAADYAALGDYLLPEVGGDADKVLHQLLGMGEGCAGQTLENEADSITFLGLADDAEGIIDVALAIADSTQQRGREIISGQDFLKNPVIIGNIQLAHYRNPPEIDRIIGIPAEISITYPCFFIN